MQIRFLLYKRKLIEQTININKKNIFAIRFFLENEVKKIRKNLMEYKHSGKINNICYPSRKIKSKKIINLFISRKSMIQVLKILKQPKNLNIL